MSVDPVRIVEVDAMFRRVRRMFVRPEAMSEADLRAARKLRTVVNDRTVDSERRAMATQLYRKLRDFERFEGTTLGSHLLRDSRGNASKQFVLNVVDEDQPDTVIPYVDQTVYAEATGLFTLGHRRAVFARAAEGFIQAGGGVGAWYPLWSARMADILYTKGGSGGSGFLTLAIRFFAEGWDPATLTWNNQPTPETGVHYLEFASLVPRTAAGDTAGESPVPGFVGFESSDWPLSIAAVNFNGYDNIYGFSIVADFKSSFALTGDALEAGPFTDWERYL